jgi:hypothetical protein
MPLGVACCMALPALGAGNRQEIGKLLDPAIAAVPLGHREPAIRFMGTPPAFSLSPDFESFTISMRHIAQPGTLAIAFTYFGRIFSTRFAFAEDRFPPGQSASIHGTAGNSAHRLTIFLGSAKGYVRPRLWLDRATALGTAQPHRAAEGSCALRLSPQTARNLPSPLSSTVVHTSDVPAVPRRALCLSAGRSGLHHAAAVPGNESESAPRFSSTQAGVRQNHK